MITNVLLSYIPFVHPMSVFNDYWYLLLVPLSFGIAVIYRALYLPVLHKYWRHVITFTLLVVLAMVGVAILLIFFVQYAIPIFAANP